MRSSDMNYNTRPSEDGFDHVLGVSRTDDKPAEINLEAKPIEFSREGNDLVIQLVNGETVLVTDYFMAGSLADLVFGQSTWASHWVAK